MPSFKSSSKLDKSKHDESAPTTEISPERVLTKYNLSNADLDDSSEAEKSESPPSDGIPKLHGIASKEKLNVQNMPLASTSQSILETDGSIDQAVSPLIKTPAARGSHEILSNVNGEPQVLPFEVDAILSYEKSNTFENKVGNAEISSKKNLNFKKCGFHLRSLFFSGRTERAIRVTICLIPALLCTYQEWIPVSRSYTCALLFVLMSALIPPLIYGISIVGLMAFPAGVLGVTILTASWAAGVAGWSIGPKWSMFLIYSLLVMTLAPWKIGKIKVLTGMAALIAVYACELPFFVGLNLIEDGIVMRMPIKDFMDLLKQAANSIPDSFPPPALNIERLILIDSINQAIKAFFVSEQVMALNLILPSSITKVSPDYQSLINLPVNMTIDTKHGFKARIPSGSWIIKMAWTASTDLAMVQATLKYGGVALGLFILSLLLPPQRFIRSYLRDRAANAVRQTGVLIRLMAGHLHFNLPVHLQHDGVVVERSVSDKSAASAILVGMELGDVRPSRKDFRITLNNKDSQLQQQSTILSSNNKLHSNYKRRQLGFTIHSSMDPEELYPLLDKADAQTKTFIRRYECASDTTPETLDERLRRSILALEDLKPLIAVSAMEPSFSNPGPFTAYFLRWAAVLDSLRRCNVHAKGFWDMVNCSFRPENETLWPDFPLKNLKSTNDCSHLQKLIAMANETTVLTIEIYELTGNLIGLKPVSRGSQLETVMRQRSLLKELMEDILIQRSKLSSMSMELLFSSATTEGWKVAVRNEAVAQEFTQAVIESPMQLSVAVEDLLEEQSSKKIIRGSLLTIVGFCVPFLGLVSSWVQGFIRIIMPWRWQWKQKHPKYVSTGLPWWRNTDVQYCIKWITGIIILFALSVFSDKYRSWLVTGKRPTNAYTYIGGTTGKLPSWTSLGYLTTIFMTLEGTVHRAGLRAIGVCLGTFLAWLCLIIMGSTNVAGQIVWLCITTFIAVAVGGNPTSAVLGFHPSWGYAAQLFTYQQTIIVVEAYFSVQHRDELVVARLLGQLIGVGTAVLISLILFPNVADQTIRHSSVEALYTLRQSVVALAESLVLNRDEGSEGVAQPRTWEERRCFICNTRARKEALISSIDPDIQSRRRQRRELMKNFAKAYKKDSSIVLEKIADHVKELGVFKEFPLGSIDPQLGDSIIYLQLMATQLEAFFDLEHNMPSAFALKESTAEFRALLIAFCELGDYIEEAVLDTAESSGWFSSYKQIFCNVFFSSKHRTSLRQDRLLEVQNGIKDRTAKINAAFEDLGSKFPKVQAAAIRADKKAQENINMNDATAKHVEAMHRIPSDLWVWLTATHYLVQYGRALQKYVDAVFTHYSIIN